MIYLDYAANCPVEEDVLKVFNDVTRNEFANPNSFHQLGLQAKAIIDESSAYILKQFHHDDDEIIYTSGASEANNLMIKGIATRYKNRGKHIIIGSLEHNSLTAPATTLAQNGYQIDVLPLNKDGLVDLETLKTMMKDDTILVSVCAVDSELGIAQPIEDIADIVHQYAHCLFHSDASQAVGKTNIDFQNVDLITVTPHKFYGLNGTGALIKRKDIGLTTQIEGGRSTTRYRSGTPVTAQIAAFAKALSIVEEHKEERNDVVKKYHEELNQFFNKYEHVHINSTKYTVPHIINISLSELPLSAFLDEFEKQNIYLSTKSSCCPKNKPSKAIYAITKSKALASSSMRISLSHLTTFEEILKFMQVFDHIYREVNHGEI